MIIILYLLGFLFILAIFLHIFLPNTAMHLLSYAKKLKKDSSEQYIAYFILISLMAMDAAIITYLTNFFPFSLLYKNTLGHAKNKPLKAFVDSMEKYLKTEKMPVLITSGDLTRPLGTLYAEPVGRYKMSKSDYLVNLEKVLQEQYKTVFVRDNKTGFKILVSTEAIMK